MGQGVQLVVEMNRWAWSRFKDALQDATPEEIRVRLTVRLYGRGVARRLFGRVPADAV